MASHLRWLPSNLLWNASYVALFVMQKYLSLRNHCTSSDIFCISLNISAVIHRG